MSRNYGNEVVGEVGSKLFPIIMSSRPLMSFFAVVSFGFFLVVQIHMALSAMTDSAERFDRYMRDSTSLPIILMLLIPAFIGTMIVSRLTRNNWITPLRKTKILAILLALTGLWVTYVSFSNGSQIWSQLSYHRNGENKGKSLLMSQTCPTEVAKPGYDRIAHDPKSPYAITRCQDYLNSAQVENMCWREYQTMKPLAWSVCSTRRRELTGVNWPEEENSLSSLPKQIYATEAQMRAVIAKKGLSPL